MCVFFCHGGGAKIKCHFIYGFVTGVQCFVCARVYAYMRIPVVCCAGVGLLVPTYLQIWGKGHGRVGIYWRIVCFKHSSAVLAWLRTGSEHYIETDGE